jgi:hypothetical protein
MSTKKFLSPSVITPTLLNLYDDQGAITGSFDAGKMTDDRRPTLTGIAEVSAATSVRL